MIINNVCKSLERWCNNKARVLETLTKEKVKKWIQSLTKEKYEL